MIIRMWMCYYKYGKMRWRIYEIFTKLFMQRLTSSAFFVQILSTPLSTSPQRGAVNVTEEMKTYKGLDKINKKKR